MKLSNVPFQREYKEHIVYVYVNIEYIYIHIVYIYIRISVNTHIYKHMCALYNSPKPVVGCRPARL